MPTSGTIRLGIVPAGPGMPVDAGAMAMTLGDVAMTMSTRGGPLKDAEELKRVRRDNAELKRTNEISRGPAACQEVRTSCCSSRPTTLEPAPPANQDLSVHGIEGPPALPPGTVRRDTVNRLSCRRGQLVEMQCRGGGPVKVPVQPLSRTRLLSAGS